MRLLKCFLIFFFFALKKLEKPPQKVAYLSRNSVVSEISLSQYAKAGAE